MTKSEEIIAHLDKGYPIPDGLLAIGVEIINEVLLLLRSRNRRNDRFLALEISNKLILERLDALEKK